jgi:hypothetical protein
VEVPDQVCEYRPAIGAPPVKHGKMGKKMRGLHRTFIANSFVLKRNLRIIKPGRVVTFAKARDFKSVHIIDREFSCLTERCMVRSGCVALAFAIIGAGCADKRPELVHVTGQLYWEGKHAVGAVVFFHPEENVADSQNPARGPQIQGTVGENGTFEMSAPPGRYRVSVIWVKNSGQGDEATNLLPAKFMSPATAGLPIVEVGDQPTVLEPFKLSS